MRPAHAAAVLTLAIASLLLPAAGASPQDSRLPDIGSSAGSVLSPAQQAQYGAMTLSQLRNYGYTLDDPLLAGWLQALGDRLAASSDKPKEPFTFFMLRERQINAFATLGGYIAVNAGLVLAADSEDEIAAVMAHEVAHVTQTHVLRAVERAQRDSVPILLAMLGAIAVAHSSGRNSHDDPTKAAVMSAQGLLAQPQTNYPPGNQAEAHRIGFPPRPRPRLPPPRQCPLLSKTCKPGGPHKQGRANPRAPPQLP